MGNKYTKDIILKLEAEIEWLDRLGFVRLVEMKQEELKKLKEKLE